MVKFKCKEAQKAFDEAQELEDYVASKEKEYERLGIMTEYDCELLTEAAGLRVLADELEAEYLKNNS